MITSRHYLRQYFLFAASLERQLESLLVAVRQLLPDHITYTITISISVVIVFTVWGYYALDGSHSGTTGYNCTRSNFIEQMAFFIFLHFSREGTPTSILQT